MSSPLNFLPKYMMFLSTNAYFSSNFHCYPLLKVVPSDKSDDSVTGINEIKAEPPFGVDGKSTKSKQHPAVARKVHQWG